MTFYSGIGILVRASKRDSEMRRKIAPPVSQRLLALGTRVKTCPKCERQEVVVEGPVNGHWIIQPHSPEPGGTLSCMGIDMRIPLTLQEKTLP